MEEMFPAMQWAILPRSSSVSKKTGSWSKAHAIMRQLLLLMLFVVSSSLQAQNAVDSESVQERNGADTTELGKLRLQIDSLDNELIQILAERMKVCLAVGEYKKEHRMAVVQSNRYNELLKRLCEQGKEAGLGEQFVKEIMDTIHKESVRQQEEFIEKCE
jgi:chorismate mutase